MKLGIIVVYLISEENEQLLDIHLDQIKKNTDGDYTIYANVNMLIPRFIKKLENRNNTKIFKCDNYVGPNDGNRAILEHMYYGEKLIECAIKDGMTHLIMMHLDSFPIKKGWNQILANKLSKSNAVLLSNFPAMTASMFFHRNFYLKYHPKLLPSDNILKKFPYKQFAKSIKAENLIETGMGYAYEAYKRNLKWTVFDRSNKGEDHYHFGSIFEDLIFHLGASEHNDRSFGSYKEKPRLSRTKKIIGNILPPVVKERIKTSKLQEFIRPEIKSHKYYHSIVKEKLFTDPDRYIKFLRTGFKN